MSIGIEIVTWLLLISFVLTPVNSARILAVFPTPSISHQIVFRPLTQELIRRGHEVTVITTDPAFSKEDTPLNLTEIDVHDLSYQMWIECLVKEEGIKKDNVDSQFDLLFRLATNIFEAQLTTDKVQNIVNKRQGQFDLLILEAYLNPLLVFTHIYNIPTIQISSVAGFQYNYEVFGVTTHPFLYHGPPQPKLYKLSNLEKLEHLYYRWRMNRVHDVAEQEADKLLRKLFGDNIPPVKELSKNVDMLFVNSHPIWMNNQPLPPSVVHIGGIHIQTPKDLPKESYDLGLVLDASINGVIYFSFGTNVIPSLLPSDKIQMMIKVFSQLPYDVIWKWDQDSMPGKTANIKLYKWLPQSDLLRHPKIKLFITQCGLQSTDEAVDAGVPLIGIPILADQWYNSELYRQHNIGVKLDFSSLTEETFRRAIETVIGDKRYKENVKRLSDIVKDEPHTPLERAVWWTEYVLRHGGAKHLRAAGANISWAQYLELELVTIVILVLLSFLILLLIAAYIIWKFSSDFRPTSKTKKS